MIPWLASCFFFSILTLQKYIFIPNYMKKIETFLLGRAPSGRAFRYKSSLACSLRAFRFNPSRMLFTNVLRPLNN
jgi:hypothetical protein